MTISLTKPSPVPREHERLLSWEAAPTNLSEFSAFKKLIKDFKKEYALTILQHYHDASLGHPDLGPLFRFLPVKHLHEEQGTVQGRRNLGLYSTAVCLEVISSYDEELKALPDHCSPEWTGTTADSRRRFVHFLLMGLSGKLPLHPLSNQSDTVHAFELGTLPKASILDKLHGYLSNSNVRNTFLDELTGNEREMLFLCLRDTFVAFSGEFFARREVVHPFSLYKFLRFLDAWNGEVVQAFRSIPKNRRPDALRQIPDHRLRAILEEHILDASLDTSQIFNVFFDEIYLSGKYELYRQLALKLSNDLALYDAKRLGYSLLVVTHRNRFSNNLIRDKALNTLFEAQRQNPNDLWPTGQLLPLSQDGLMAVSSIELASDLLNSPSLFRQLNRFLPELKAIYDFHARTMQGQGLVITGWYPPDQRDKTPLSYVTAFVLSFIKGFCRLLTYHVAEQARNHFQLNKRKPTESWAHVYDCSTVKWKLRMIGREDHRFRSAILFGPPGTGKTTFARALASHLEKEYLELTPGDFFAGGENFILQRINDIFENMLHLTNTVVFIDEIDDLVRSRKGANGGSPPFDPRDLYVNTLLPRFQEIRNRGEVILILSTNHFSKVDPAIARLGRIDLVIPVGGLSPHGRLKLLSRRIDLATWTNRLGRQALCKFLVDYLRGTQHTNYSELDIMLRNALKRNEVPGVTCNVILNRIKKGSFKRQEEIRQFYSKLSEYENIRPIFMPQDVEDYDELPTNLTESACRLFLNLNLGQTRGAKQIKTLVENLVHEQHYNLVTGFYDDLLDFNRRTSGGVREAMDAIDALSEQRRFF